MEQKQPDPKLLKQIENGIQVHKAVFHQAIANGFGEPESNFSSDDPKLNRKVEMWLTPTLLVCRQNDKLFATPHANLVYVRF
jgi:hypothetical protein